MLRLVLSLILVHNALCWKPVVGPTVSYSHITNHHPRMGTQNTIIDSDGGAAAMSGHSITYHGKIFPQLEHAVQSSETVLLGAETPATSTGLEDIDEDVQGRVLSGGSAVGDETGPKFLIDDDIGNTGLSAQGVSDSGHCTVDKYALDHEGTIQYDKTIPKLEQFTLCAWMRFINHSGDHSIFTYSVDGEPREIQFWIANAKGSSYISLAVHGQSLYRLNYPLKLKKWHHACTSWNGKTGEWQLWIKAERVGRGFHNRIVGHVIKPHGILYSGGPSITGPVAIGLHMEVTLVQLYKVALSAGKAHRDHKHHHVHHFDHNGPATSTLPPPPPPPPQPSIPPNAILANGQINTRLRINFAGAQPQPAAPSPTLIPGNLPTPTISTLFNRGQFSSGERLLTQQLFGTRLKQGRTLAAPSSPASFVFPSSTAPASFLQIRDPSNDQNVQYIDGADDDIDSHFVFKRNDAPKRSSRIRQSRSTIRRPLIEKTQKKRALVSLTDGSVIDDRDLAENAFAFDGGLAQFGAAAYQDALTGPKNGNIEDEIKQHDREPAEGEVKAVLNLCSVCQVEPFQGAILLAWKDAHISLEGALLGHSLGGCGNF